MRNMIFGWIGLPMTLLALSVSSVAQAEGLLKVHPQNPRYVADQDGNAIFLTGSHTWAAFQERGVEGETPDFDYEEYLEFLEQHDHNFMRLWTWEQAQWMQFAGPDVPIRYSPNPYLRTGPGHALDGKPKFDVTKFNPEYFKRLRKRVEMAGEREIYVAVMLFQGFSLSMTRGDEMKGNAWHGHPFHSQNNINGFDGNPSHDDTGYEVHQLAVPEITALQEAFIRKTIDTVGDLDHVLWEICNESPGGSPEWQYHLIRVIKQYESERPTQHLVGMTGAPIKVDVLLASPADWISPPTRSFIDNPPANTGAKIVIADSDHGAPWIFDLLWPWKHLLRGNHFILMDGYRDYRTGSPEKPLAEWDDTRDAMGQARRLSEQIDLASMLPIPKLASTGYCLANEGVEYVVLLTESTKGPLQMTLPPGKYTVEWLRLVRGSPTVVKPIEVTGKRHEFVPPWDGPSVLHLKRAETNFLSVN